jgi:hypothetical protein
VHSTIISTTAQPLRTRSSRLGASAIICRYILAREPSERPLTPRVCQPIVLQLTCRARFSCGQRSVRWPSFAAAQQESALHISGSNGTAATVAMQCAASCARATCPQAPRVAAHAGRALETSLPSSNDARLKSSVARAKVASRMPVLATMFTVDDATNVYTKPDKSSWLCHS